MPLVTILLSSLLLLFQHAVAFQLSSSSLRTASMSSGQWIMHFEEAMKGNTKLSADALPAERFLASNRFKVRPGAMAKFEKRWAERKSRLATLPGFRFFSLFKRVAIPGATIDDDEPNYLSSTYWESKEHFDAWRTGDAFKEAHGGGSIFDFIKLLNTALFILKGSPKLACFDALHVFNGQETLSFATDNGWRSVVADGVNELAPDVFMSHSRFSVLPGMEAAFEQQWATPLQHLKDMPGLVGYSLLRRDAERADDGYNYISATVWRDQAAFDHWRGSAQFKLAHSPTPGDVKCFDVPPKLACYVGKLTLISDKGW